MQYIRTESHISPCHRDSALQGEEVNPSTMSHQSMAFDWRDIPGDHFCSAEYISSVLFPVQSQFNAHCSCPYDDDLSSYSSFSISLCSTGAFIPPFRFVSMSSINYSRAQLGPLSPANTFSNQRPLEENSRSLYWVNIF